MEVNAYIIGECGESFYAQVKCDECGHTRMFSFKSNQSFKLICRNLSCQSDMAVRFGDLDQKKIKRG